MMLPTGPLEQAMTVRSRPLMQTLPDPNMLPGRPQPNP